MYPVDGRSKTGEEPVEDDELCGITSVLGVVVNEMAADLILFIQVVVNFDQVLRLIIAGDIQIRVSTSAE